ELDVGLDGGVLVGDRGGFQRCLGHAGRLSGLMPEAGVGEKAGSALRVVDDCDLEERVGRALAAAQLPGEGHLIGRRPRPPTPWRAGIWRTAAARRSGCSPVVRWPPGNVRISAWGTRSRAAGICRCS